MKNRKDKFFRNWFWPALLVIVLGILTYTLLDNFVAVRAWFRQLFSIIKPFVSGLAVAYLLNMPMRFFERKLFANMKAKRALSILLSYIIAFILLALLLWLVLPQLVSSISTVISALSFYLGNLDQTIEKIAGFLHINPSSLQFIPQMIEEGLQTLIAYIRDMLPQIANFAFSIGSSVINTFTAIIASIYLLSGKEKLLRQCKKITFAIFPKKASNEIMRVSTLANNVFSGFISGKLLDSAIIGAICFLFMMVLVLMNLISVPIATLVSVIIGLTNIIPFFGPFLGAVPVILILITINPAVGLVFAIFVIILQQFDGNVLGPKILGDTTGLPAFWVLVSIIVGGGLFGFTGMLLGVPTAAVLYSVINDLVTRQLAQKGIDIDEPASYKTSDEVVMPETDEKEPKATDTESDEGSKKNEDNNASDE